MATRPCDLLIAAAALVPAAPVCLLAAAGIWLTDGLPVLYKSRRVGRGGRVFTMYKFRTMRIALPTDPSPQPSPPSGAREAGTPRPACGERVG
jgi:lipopolysaccharide/colanic/teichoic acid biosynthesis glycosyltransferase